MTNRQKLDLAFPLLLAGCQASTVHDATNEMAQTVAALPAIPMLPSQADGCTDPDVQATLRSLIKPTIEAQLQQGFATGTYQGPINFYMVGPVMASIKKIAFTQTTIEHVDTETRGLTCATSLGIDGDTGANVRPRLTFRVQPSLDGGDGVVTLAQPAEVTAAIPLLFAATARLEKATASTRQASLPRPVTEYPVAAELPSNNVDDVQSAPPKPTPPAIGYLPTTDKP